MKDQAPRFFVLANSEQLRLKKKDADKESAYSLSVRAPVDTTTVEISVMGSQEKKKIRNHSTIRSVPVLDRLPKHFHILPQA